MAEGVKKEIVKTVEKSVTPYYIAAAVWLAGSLFLLMYRLSSYMILAGGAIIAFAFSKKKYDKIIVKEVEVIDNPLLHEAVEEGRKLIVQLKEANEKIDDHKLSVQIDSFVEITESILQTILDKPDKVTEIRKFLNYYLPTCINLLDHYAYFEKQKMKGDNVLKSMNKITGMMDMIETAFRKQLDSLFDNETLDIGADITVLEGMLKQEGLDNKTELKF